MEWHPIETAPRDGTPVLVWCEGRAMVAAYGPLWTPDNPVRSWLVSHAERVGEGGIRMVTDIGPGERPWGREGPSHWSPIPAAPDTTIAASQVGMEPSKATAE